jgi:pilus assembly protein CpaE
VLLIGNPGPTQEQIQAALNMEQEFDLVDLLSSTERLSRDVSASEADIILVDHQISERGGLDIIDDLALQFPNTAIIAILPENEPTMTQQVMLAGARAFIVKPFTQTNLTSTLRRIRTLEEARFRHRGPEPTAEPERTRALRVVTVYSPKGGVGTSTIATNLALSHYEKTGQSVLLMDGKLFFSHLDVALNIRTKNSIADLIPHAGSLDEGLINEVVYHHASGIHVLMGPSNINVAQGIRPDDLFAVFMGLQRQYDLIIIDAGSALTENTVTLMDAADRILLVSTPDLVSLHETSNFIVFSQALSYPTDKLLITINRADIKGGISIGDVEAALHRQVFHQIPDDEALVLRSLNRGVPITIRYPRSPVSRAFKTLAEKLGQLSEKDTASQPAGARVRAIA